MKVRIMTALADRRVCPLERPMGITIKRQDGTSENVRKGRKENAKGKKAEERNAKGATG